MCRFAAYAGAPLSLGSLMYDAPHSLERQSYVPRQMISGHVNVDGTGVAWWQRGESEPLRYVSERPPWSDPNLPLLGRRISGTPIVAVVRSQTPGMPAGVSSAHPFCHHLWAGSHNGYLEHFADLKWDLVELVDAELRAAIETLSDSALLFLVAVSKLRNGTAATVADAVVATAEAAAGLCAAHGAAASLNLLLAGADEVVALRMARGVDPNSLYWLDKGREWPQGAVIASEPLDDDDGWTPVPPDHVVRLSSAGVDCSAANFSV